MSATIDQLIRENVRLRDLLARFVSLTQDDIIAHEGLALTVSPTIAGYHGALMQEARLALGMDIWIPRWLQEDEEDETPPNSEAASKAAGSPLKPAKKMAPTTPPGDATFRKRHLP